VSSERTPQRHKKEKLNLGVPLATVGLFVIASLGAFTRKQRDAIVERDDNKCQFPEHHKHKGGLQVHHIIPQRYSEQLGIDPDFPENGLTLCEDSHHKVHPDIKRAKQTYHQKKRVGESSFNEVFQERQEKIKNKEIYWDDSWDRKMSTTAVRNTQKKSKLGWLFPKKR
jgi:hypothetical protein